MVRGAKAAKDAAARGSGTPDALIAEIKKFVGSDAMCISVLGGRFASAFNECVRRNGNKDDGSFKAWLHNSGCFIFEPHETKPKFCRVRVAR